MDTNLLLSLLSKSGNADISSLLSLLNGSKGEQNTERLFSLLTDQMMRKNENKSNPSISILGFVNDDILGKITRYMANRKSLTRGKK
ncbi:MAG: hypothetical protein IKC64_02035 [Clostridia bacterium]|nr:hypothetical protein [Clostridia bacterium]